MRIKHFILSAILICACAILVNCIGEAHVENTPMGNFEQLWKIIDERYCFFDCKDVDWDEIYYTYEEYIYPDMSDDELSYILGSMLNELRDGHVNLIINDNIASYWSGLSEYPRNFNPDIVRFEYLKGSGYALADEIEYSILDDNIAYIYYQTFTSDVKTQNMDLMINLMGRCKGMIIDVRDNAGGNISNARRLNSRFTDTKILTGYLIHKTGKGHNDFSSPTPIYIEPSKNVRWHKPVVVLTNRNTYSAANDFVNNMRYIPNVVIMGDTTGGGSGLPFTYELPNSWAVRFSASPHLDAEMNQLEFGIAPDIKVEMDSADESKRIDTIIETARKYILNNPQ